MVEDCGSGVVVEKSVVEDDVVVEGEEGKVVEDRMVVREGKRL